MSFYEEGMGVLYLPPPAVSALIFLYRRPLPCGRRARRSITVGACVTGLVVGGWEFGLVAGCGWGGSIGHTTRCGFFFEYAFYIFI